MHSLKKVKEAEFAMIYTLSSGRNLLKKRRRKERLLTLSKIGLITGLVVAILCTAPGSSYAYNGSADKDQLEQSGINFHRVEPLNHINNPDNEKLSHIEAVSQGNNVIQKAEYRNGGNWKADSSDDAKKLAAKKEAEEPARFRLKQNYPNPFNPATEITYKLPASRHVVLKVYDMLGRPIKTLVNANKEAGRYTVRFNASGLSSGMYLYRLKAGDYEQIRKMILIK